MSALTRYIARFRGEYLTPRRTTGKAIYRARSGWSDDFNDVRIFQTQAAARNAGNAAADSREVEILPVNVMLDDNDDLPGWEGHVSRSELMFTSEWVKEHPLLAATKLGKFIMKNRARGFDISFDDSDPHRPLCIATRKVKS
jgi:hypothetical protein